MAPDPSSHRKSRGGRTRGFHRLVEDLKCCITSKRVYAAAYPPLTTLISGPVVFDVDVFMAALLAGAAAEQTRPVDSVMVAQPLVSRYVHATIVYFPKGA